MRHPLPVISICLFFLLTPVISAAPADPPPQIFDLTEWIDSTFGWIHDIWLVATFDTESIGIPADNGPIQESTGVEPGAYSEDTEDDHAPLEVGPTMEPIG